MFKYFPHTKDDVLEMLKTMNINTIEELFKDIPKEVMLKSDYNIPSMHSETEIRQFFNELKTKNQELTIFSGLGVYDHYSPSVINAITSRQEFLTSYTPYQPEISQGTLQYIFEFQSMIQTLTGLEVANASMYDGTTASAEACFMATNVTRSNKILISRTVSPIITEVIKTYLTYKEIEYDFIEEKNGTMDHDDLKRKISKDIAGVFVQKPNFYGIIEDFAGVADICHENKALLIENCDISTLGILKTPGEDKADIACGDAQSLGVPMAFGGPYIGYLATIKNHVRKMPGRICGYTTDIDGNRAFVLTLQAREQHIRRSKANSNICSNQSLLALYTSVYMALMGPKGLEEVNQLSYQGAHYLYEKLLQTGKFTDPFEKPFLKEFTLKTNISSALISAALLKNDIFGGVNLEIFGDRYQGLINFCVTEKRTKAQIDKLVAVLEGLS